MRNRTTAFIGAALGASLLALAPATTADAASSAHQSTYYCRSSYRPQFWYHGINSDACDGYSGGARFGGEVSVTVDGNPAYASSSAHPITACKIQINAVHNGRVYPLRGYTASGTTYDGGHSCDVFHFWRLPVGSYNATASYESYGVWYTTVQGPVVYYPGT